MTPHEKPEAAGRRAAMATCADATAAELAGALALLGPLPDVCDLRPPEFGLVTLRGRAGGDGRPFNFGEATVTRAAVSLPGGPEGYAYHLGRDRPKARAAALLDALWQQEERRVAVEGALGPVRDRLAAERNLAARRTAATRVDFFTLVRGED